MSPFWYSLLPSFCFEIFFHNLIRSHPWKDAYLTPLAGVFKNKSISMEGEISPNSLPSSVCEGWERKKGRAKHYGVKHRSVKWLQPKLQQESQGFSTLIFLRRATVGFWAMSPFWYSLLPSFCFEIFFHNLIRSHPWKDAYLTPLAGVFKNKSISMEGEISPNSLPSTAPISIS